MRNKIIGVDEAVKLIPDGAVIATSAVGVVGYPEYLAQALERRYLETGSPKDITVVAGCSRPRDNAGDERFVHPGMLKRYIASHPVNNPKVMQRIADEEVEGYSLPQGILTQLYRATAAGQPGLISKIGIGTYIDPRQGGGKQNAAAREDIVEVLQLHGEEWLFYKSLPVTVALLRATTSDERGNLTIEEEALKLEILETALAAKANNGVVIAQVKRITENGTLKAKDVVVPGELVDAIVIAENQEETHRQTRFTVYNPYYSGELRRPASQAKLPLTQLTTGSVICRRALFELYPDAVVNIGLGIGSEIGELAEVEGMRDRISLTLELGVFGGIPTPKPDFGVAINAEAYVSHPTMFAFYHGGGLDITYLGTVQVDQKGNVNVSLISGKPSGQGGFIDISQTSKKVVFVTSFTTKGLKTEVKDKRLDITQEGAIRKFVEAADQITFNGDVAMKSGQEVLYVTERAVFRLTDKGVLLTEIAPGIDLQEDIINQMNFTPLIDPNLKVMDERIFIPGRMGIFD